MNNEKVRQVIDRLEDLYSLFVAGVEDKAKAVVAIKGKCQVTSQSALELIKIGREFERNLRRKDAIRITEEWKQSGLLLELKKTGADYIGKIREEKIRNFLFGQGKKIDDYAVSEDAVLLRHGVGGILHVLLIEDYDLLQSCVRYLVENGCKIVP